MRHNPPRLEICVAVVVSIRVNMFFITMLRAGRTAQLHCSVNSAIYKYRACHSTVYAMSFNIDTHKYSKKRKKKNCFRRKTEKRNLPGIYQGMHEV